MTGRTFVLKLGGSFLLGDGKPDLSSIKEMANTVRHVVNSGNSLIVVVGGGIPARNYIEAASHLGASNGVKDYLGMLVSRLNSRLFIEALDPQLVLAEPAETLQQVRTGLQTRPVVVVGGLQPGQSTTAVAALCCEYVKAERVVFSTDVDGVYDSDPKKNPDAKRLPRVTYDQLRNLTGLENSAPGQYRIIDGVALTILERSRIPAQILKGSQENILAAFEGKDIGTVVCHAL
eukprot:TRINITY_DN1820_c0_g1_i1.p1 TRINITY_DN1820_c0_g1~~TRINITY_DN1820_c0_g1_i1.p1  ORF type:complete len:247 (-),score=65.09 TRINITY_DN1820_c0_g1_i1:89-787(-)